MKSTLLTLITLACLSASSASEDIEDKTVTYVPFDFVVGQTILPAGRYSISRVRDDPAALVLRNADRQTSFLLV
jgi:hypothetical protein